MDDGNAWWLLLTTAVGLVAGAISGLVAAILRTREAKSERVREEVLRWANPILNAVEALDSRLENVLGDLYPALDGDRSGEERPADPDWAVSYDYVMQSTLFIFAEFFGWTRLLLQRLSFELFESRREQERFFDALWKVTKTLGDFPLDGVEGEGDDMQVFALQQREIGESMLVASDGETRVMGYPDFRRARRCNADLRASLAPLERLLEGVEPGTKRWARLELTHEAVRALRRECEALLDLERRGLRTRLDPRRRRSRDPSSGERLEPTR